MQSLAINVSRSPAASSNTVNKVYRVSPPPSRQPSTQTDRQSCYSGPCPNNTLIGLFPGTNFLLCPRKPGVKFWSLYITYVQVMYQVRDVVTSRNKNEEMFSLKFVNNVGDLST